MQNTSPFPADPRPFDLTGRIALITGASRGIGASLAWTLGEAGARVVLVARNQEPLEDLAGSLEAAGIAAMPVAAHTGYDEQVTQLAEHVQAEWGTVDIVVNNAATSPHMGSVLEADTDVFQRTFNTNVLGYQRIAKAFVPGMQAQESGKIVNIASIAGHQPAPGLGVYGVTKAAVLMLTRVLARELGSFNIQVNAISPGLIRTDFSRALLEDPAWVEQYTARTALGRVGETQDLTGLALYLAAPASNYTTGETFLVDGGYLL